MPPPTLNTPIIKEVFEEALKKKPFQSSFNNFLKIEPLIFAGRETLNAFNLLLRDVKAVQMNKSDISIELRNCSINAESFPLGFWKKISLLVPKLIVKGFDESYQMAMVREMQHSNRLCEVVSTFNMNNEAWQHLLDTSVTKISAPFRSLIDIGKLDQHFYANIEAVEAFVINDESTLFQEFFATFRIPCRSLKINKIESWFAYWDLIHGSKHSAVLPTVEKLELKFSLGHDFSMLSELKASEFLEGLQQIFPNLKELDLKIKIDEGDDVVHFGYHFVPHLEYLQIVIGELRKQLETANIKYKVAFHYCRTDYINTTQDDVTAMQSAFESAKFVEEGDGDVSHQKWTYTVNISELKDLKITCYIDEIEINSEKYADMIGDLDIGNFYSYSDGEYDDFDGDGGDFDGDEVDGDALYDDAGFDDY